MSSINKLLGSVVGSVVALVLVYLGTKGLATCTGVGDAQTCTLLGFTTAQITGAATALFSAVFVYIFPPNA